MLALSGVGVVRKVELQLLHTVRTTDDDGVANSC